MLKLKPTEGKHKNKPNAPHCFECGGYMGDDLYEEFEKHGGTEGSELICDTCVEEGV